MKKTDDLNVKKLNIIIICAIFWFSFLAKAQTVLNECSVFLPHKLHQINKLGTGQVCAPSKIDPRFKKIQEETQACQKKIESPFCQDMFKKYPELLLEKKKCSPHGVCQDVESITLDDCLQGYLVGTGEVFVELKEMGEDGIYFFKQKFLESYHGGQRIRPEKVGTLDFWRVVPQNSGNNFSEKGKANEERNEYLKNWQIQQKKFNNIGDSLNGLKNSLEEKGLRLSCVNRETAQFLMCWGASYIIDPAIAAGLIYKGLKGTAFIAKTQLKKLENSGSIKSGLVERKMINTPQPIDTAHLFGKKISTITEYKLPASMQLSTYKNLGGKEVTIYEQAVRTVEGDVKILAHELPIDSMTQFIDANFSGGQKFMQNLARESQGKVTYLSIDLNSLGFINNNYNKVAGVSKGNVVGDDYLKIVSQLIREKVDGKGVPFRTGGDELGILLQTSDEVEVKKFLEDLVAEAKARTKHLVTEEKKLNAKEFKQGISEGKDKEALTREFLDSSSGKYYSNGIPGLSVGASKVGVGEPIHFALARADERVRIAKLNNCIALARDCTKYGGSIPEKGSHPDFDYKPLVGDVAEAPSKYWFVFPYEQGPPLSIAKKGYVNELKVRDVARVGPYSISQYKNELGAETFRTNIYFTNDKGVRDFYTAELYVNKNTGFIDGRSPSAQVVLDEFLKSTGKKTSDGLQRGLIHIDARNLGKVNYFDGGTKNGDELMAATAEVMKRVLSQNEIPMKMQGSEFIVAIDNTNVKYVQAIQEKLAKELQNSPEVQTVYNKQKIIYEEEIKELRKKKIPNYQQAVEALEKKKKELEELLKEKFRIKSSMI